MATAKSWRKAAEVAQRFTGWTVWLTAQGRPVATRSGRQRPPEPYDGNWAQTVIADDWDELEAELTAQAKYDEQRLTNQARHRLQYQTLETCRPYSCLCVADGIEYFVELADDARSGGLADLVTTEYPEIRLSDMTLAPATRVQLEQVLHEQRQRDLLGSRGFAPLRRLLLTGPDGTGKSMTASALATELSLPLVTIRIGALIGTGEPEPKLRVIFDAMARARSVCLFDNLDAIGARQMAGFQFDIVDGHRVLNTFLSFLDDIQSESLIVAVADHPSLLDHTPLRRFDAVIAYYLARSHASP
jgi:SpoVK/Ycf46/Vps4 family AAA+-type ATPase